jgi:ATP-dependent helicase/nuclease subunit A
MTRAREWLVFSSTAPHRAASGPSWWQRVSACAERWTPDALVASGETAAADATEGAAMAASARRSAQVCVLPLLHRLAQPVAPMLAADIGAARLGQAVHRVLEWAGQLGRPPGALDLASASQAAAREFALPPAAALRVPQLAGQILASPACARFFVGAALRWAGTEVPVSSQGESLRIDRLVALRDPDTDAGPAPTTWWVLDYKLHAAPAEWPAYRAQLTRYIAAVQALQPDDAVRGAFITGTGAVVEP